jgi:hypothetical protein
MASKKSNVTVVDVATSVALVDVAMDFSEAVVDSEATATEDEDAVVEELPVEAAAQRSPKWSMSVKALGFSLVFAVCDPQSSHL